MQRYRRYRGISGLVETAVNRSLVTQSGPGHAVSPGPRLPCPTGFWGTMMDIGGWLRGLGLGKYEAAFRENEIDETVLPSLTEEHLKQLGVTALGHRVKLLDAIAAVRTDASAQDPLSHQKTAPGAGPTLEDRAERRQV